jgi:hypothetical protein
VRHHQQVVLLAMPILDVVVERGFGAKTEALENPNSAWLIGDHLREQLLEPGPLGQLEDRFGQQVAEPPPSICGMRDDANLSDMTRPAMALTFEDGRADDSLAHHRDHRGLAIEVDLVEPGLDFLAIYQVFFEKSAVVFGYFFEESTNFGPILRNQGAFNFKVLG